MNNRFTSKINSLSLTTERLYRYDAQPLSDAIAAGTGRHAVLIGSGGSAIAAEYFARCRETLRLGHSSVETPMQFVLGNNDVSQCEIWFFSASADNPDIIAAVRAASRRNARRLYMITRGPEGEAAREIAELGGAVHVVEVGDQKDGYLATHSLVGTIACLLIACDNLADEPRGKRLIDEFSAKLEYVLSPLFRTRAKDLFKDLNPDDTLILVGDPQVRSISTLLETSAWESGLCCVQNTDVRNFAHGRHAWLFHRGERTVVLALIGLETAAVWEPIKNAIPPNQRCVTLNFGDCGRFANAAGVLEGLALIEAMGVVLNIDPGKPGIGTFGKEIYGDDSLRTLSSSMISSVRHKRSAIFKNDTYHLAEQSLIEIEASRLSQLAGASFGGIVLDYDGTIVWTHERYSTPGQEVVAELTRLHRLGVRIGIATGRGGSAGKDLRSVLPPEMHSAVLVGYYNGGYIRPLSVDIKIDKPPSNPVIAKVIHWLSEKEDLFLTPKVIDDGVQITIHTSDLADPVYFSTEVLSCPLVSNGSVRVVRSGHSFDIIPSEVTKLLAVEMLAAEVSEGLAVLCIGDSGGKGGNDYALLSNPYGVSVGDVCGSPQGCWSIFGDEFTGPNALVKVLQALDENDVGEIRMNVDALTLDRLG